MSKLKDLLKDPAEVGDINSSGRITQEGTFAEIYAFENTVETVAPPSVFTKVVGFTNNGHSKNCQPDAANNQIIGTKAGYYSFDCSSSFSSDTNNVKAVVAAYSNGVKQNNIHYQRKISTSGDTGAAPASGVIKVLNDGDMIDLRVKHDNIATVNLTFIYGNFKIVYIGKL